MLNNHKQLEKVSSEGALTCKRSLILQTFIQPAFIWHLRCVKHYTIWFTVPYQASFLKGSRTKTYLRPWVKTEYTGLCSLDLVSLMRSEFPHDPKVQKFQAKNLIEHWSEMLSSLGLKGGSCDIVPTEAAQLRAHIKCPRSTTCDKTCSQTKSTAPEGNWMEENQKKQTAEMRIE